MRTRFGDIDFDLVDGWLELEDERVPTLVRDNGAGAFQITTATYQSGILPQVELADLEELLSGLRGSRGLGEPTAVTHESSPERAILSAEFSDLEYWTRVWYLTDGRSVSLLTYTCAMVDFAVGQKEAGEVDRMVRSARFPV